MSRANLFWIIDGKIQRNPSAEALRNLTDNDYAGILVGGAQNDRFGIAFNPHPIYMRFSGGDATNAAAALRDLLLAYPIHASKMRSTPLFFYNESYAPFTAALVDAAFAAVCLSFMTEERFALISWHSWRVTLACNLLQAGAPASVIMALLRWKSEQMLLVYARWSAESYSAWLDASEGHSTTCVQGPNIPPPTVIAGGDPLEQTPGALKRHAYTYLTAVQKASFIHPSAEQMQQLASEIPETDETNFAQEMPAALQSVGIEADEDFDASGFAIAE
jgi:hypothetical protein